MRTLSFRAVLAALAVLACAAPAANAAVKLSDWTDCGDEFQCAVATVPVDYSNPTGPTIELNVARLPHTGPGKFLGPLFINFGGPGDSAAETFRAVGKDVFAAFRANFDVMAVDPRGTGPNGLDCHVNQFTQGLYAQPFFTP